MDFEEYFRNNFNDGLSAPSKHILQFTFEAGQQSKQAEIDALKAKIQELWTELDDRQSKEHIIERCESIIKEILK